MHIALINGHVNKVFIFLEVMAKKAFLSKQSTF